MLGQPDQAVQTCAETAMFATEAVTLLEPTHTVPMLAPLRAVAGGWLLATAHIVTAIIGAGVLGLPYALSWLGAEPTGLVQFHYMLYH